MIVYMRREREIGDKETEEERRGRRRREKKI